MTDPVNVAVIAAGAVVISGMVGAIAAVFSAVYGKRNGHAIQEVHLSLNSRLEQLIEASRSQGQMQERDARRAHDEKQNPPGGTLP